MRHTLFVSLVVLIITIVTINYLIKNSEIKFDHSLIKIGAALPVSADKLQKISKYKFYVLLVDKKQTFPKNYLAPLAGAIEKMDGLAEIADFSHPLFTEIFGFNNDRYQKIFSIVIIIDKSGTIMGIYPNKRIDELVDILQLHPDLIDLSLAGTAL